MKLLAAVIFLVGVFGLLALGVFANPRRPFNNAQVTGAALVSLSLYCLFYLAVT